MNAHINYDLPQALILVITDQAFDDPALVERRSRDHERIDAILSGRVAAEDGELRKMEQAGDRSLLDHLLTPFNRAGSKRFLKEARGKVWRNASRTSDAPVRSCCDSPATGSAYCSPTRDARATAGSASPVLA